MCVSVRLCPIIRLGLVLCSLQYVTLNISFLLLVYPQSQASDDHEAEFPLVRVTLHCSGQTVEEYMAVNCRKISKVDNFLTDVMRITYTNKWNFAPWFEDPINNIDRYTRKCACILLEISCQYWFLMASLMCVCVSHKWNTFRDKNRHFTHIC